MNYFVYPGIIQADFYKFCNKAYTGNGRMYDPALGRFLSPDPFMQSSLNTQNFNRYSYCLNNPLKFTDPSGFVYSGATPHSYFSSPSYPVIYGNYGGASLNTYEGPSGGYYLDGMFIPGRFSLCGVGAANIDRIDIGQNNFFNSSTHGNFKKPTVAGSWQTKMLYDSWIQVQKPFGTSNDYEEYTCTSETYGEFALTTEFVPTLTAVQKDIVRDVQSEMSSELNWWNASFSAMGIAGDVASLSNGSFRFKKGGSFSFKYYSSGWTGGSRANITTYSISKSGKNLSAATGVITTGMSYYDIYDGKSEPITYADATVGTVGVINSAASYFYGVEIPIVGEFVAVYGAFRFSWDIGCAAGEQWGSSKWYGTDDTKWFK